MLLFLICCSSASPFSTQTFFCMQGQSCHRLDSQEPRQQRSATVFGNVCLFEPTGWLEGKNNILRKLGQLIPAGWGRSGQACLVRAQWASLAQKEQVQTGPSSQHTFCYPLSPVPEPVLGLCHPSPFSPIAFGGNHPSRDPQGDDGAASCGVPLPRPARRAVPGGPREAVYIVGTVI